MFKIIFWRVFLAVDQVHAYLQVYRVVGTSETSFEATTEEPKRWMEFSGIDLADDETFVTNRFAPAHRVIRLLHSRAIRLSIASSSFGSTPSASIIALTPESDKISAIVGSRFQFERSASIAPCAAVVRLGDETVDLGFFTENIFRLMLRGRHHANYLHRPSISLRKIVANLNLGLERVISAGAPVRGA